MNITTLLTINNIIAVAVVFLTGLIFYLAGKLLKKLVFKKTTPEDNNDENFKWALAETISPKLGMLGLITGIFIATSFVEIPAKYAPVLSKTSGFLLAIWCVLVIVWFVFTGTNLLFKKHPDLVGLSIVKNLLIFLACTIVLVSFLSFIGIDITPALAALGVGSLAIALGLQDTLSNLFAGIQIILSRKFKPGNYIMISSLSLEGTILEITWRYTTLQTLRNELVIIPNSALAQSAVTNVSLPEKEFIAVVKFSVAYGSDLKKVEAVTLEVIQKLSASTEGAVSGFKGTVLTWEFGDSGIELLAVLKGEVYAKHRSRLRSTFIKELHQRFAEENIEFPFPTRTLYVKKQPYADQELDALPDISEIDS